MLLFIMLFYWLLMFNNMLWFDNIMLGLLGLLWFYNNILGFDNILWFDNNILRVNIGIFILKRYITSIRKTIQVTYRVY